MHTFKILLALPVLTALASPMSENKDSAGSSPFWKRGGDSAVAQPVPDFPKRDVPPEAVNFPKRDVPPEAVNFPKRDAPPEAVNFPKRDAPPEAVNFPKRDAPPEAVNFPKRDSLPEAVNFPKRDVPPEAVNFPKRDGPPEAINFPKRDGPSEAVNFPKRDNAPDNTPEVAAPVPDFPKRDNAPDVAKPVAQFWKNDNTPEVAAPVPDFPKREVAKQQPWKRYGILDVAAPIPDFPKRDIAPEVAKQQSWKRSTPENNVQSTSSKQIWRRNNTTTTTQQPNLPELIDTSACLCGLLPLADTLPHNGEIIEMWRCTASLDTDISTHTHGKWFNTTYPSQELSGTGEGRTWDENPPYVGQTFVLVHEHGGAYYEVLTPADSGELVGGDADCTGVKDDAASATWYGTQS